MLLTLARKSLYQDDLKKQKEILEKYKKYIIPEDKAEWVGLTLKDAMWKQWNIEKKAGLHDPEPLLEVYKRKLIAEIDAEAESSSTEADVFVIDAPANKT